jgi:predicted RND superfamily exporter protein
MAGFIFRYRWLIIIICFLIGILSVIVIPRTRIDPEIRNYIPAAMPSRIATDKIEKQFGVQDMIAVIFTDSCIVNRTDLERIRAIDRGISRLESISDRISPFSVRIIGEDKGMMIVKPLIGEIPDDGIATDTLKKEILKNKFAKDIVFSSDLTTAAITATINSSIPERVTIRKIDSIISAYPGRATVLKGGLPYIRQNIIKDVSRDAVILVPLALLLMLLILKVNLGNWRSVFLPFSVVLLSTAFSLALIPLSGWKMSIITLLIPVILVAVGNNYGIYLVARYQELRNQNPGLPPYQSLSSLLRSLNMPILFSGLTTIAGVLGLMTHSIIPARQVGILSAAGITLALMMSLLLIPALILVTGTIPVKHPVKDRTRLFSNLISRLSAVIIKSPGRVLAFSLIVVVIMLAGIFLLRINTNQEDYFSRKHPVRQASEIINSKFGGSQTISVMAEGDIKDPKVLQGIDRLTRLIGKQKGVGNVFSISEVVREMSKAIYAPDEYGYNKIPESRDAIAQMFELYNMSGDPSDFQQLMDPEGTRAQILVRLSDPSNIVIRAVKNKITELTKGFPAKVTIGGYGLIMSDFAASVIKGQVSSLLFAVIAVFILLAIIFRSIGGGLIGSLPLITSIIILFGFMGYSGIALDAATALLSSVMIGVGVDFTIQYIWCFNLLIRDGLDYPEATLKALKTIGRSIIINAFSVMGGFSALMFSGFTSIRFFGYLVVLSIGSCLIGAIVIIPAFLLKFRPGFIGFETGGIKNNKDEKYIDINIKPAPVAGSRASS